MRTFLFILFFGVVSHADAQMFDSIQQSFQYKPKFLLKFDKRNSFITNQYAKINGVKVGLSYNNTSKVGLGYHWMNKRLVKVNLPNRDSAHLKFGYGIGFFEYAFFQNKHWIAEIPIQIGVGSASYNDKTTNSILANTWMFIYEPAMTIEYRFLKYFGIGGGVGFRLVAKYNKEVKEKFTAPEYIFRFKIYFSDIYKEEVLKE